MEFVKAESAIGSDESGQWSQLFCQWDLPEFASSLLNTLAPDSWARVSSTFGRGCVSLRTLEFSGFMSTQILIAPDFFGIATIPAHQTVGSSTFGITFIL